MANIQVSFLMQKSPMQKCPNHHSTLWRCFWGGYPLLLRRGHRKVSHYTFFFSCSASIPPDPGITGGGCHTQPPRTGRPFPAPRPRSPWAQQSEPKAAEASKSPGSSWGPASHSNTGQRKWQMSPLVLSSTDKDENPIHWMRMQLPFSSHGNSLCS